MGWRKMLIGRFAPLFHWQQIPATVKMNCLGSPFFEFLALHESHLIVCISTESCSKESSSLEVINPYDGVNILIGLAWADGSIPLEVFLLGYLRIGPKLFFCVFVLSADDVARLTTCFGQSVGESPAIQSSPRYPLGCRRRRFFPL
jgi:hypothetical protein